MRLFSTHSPRPLRPPGRKPLSLLPLLLLLLLPAWSAAQGNICFEGLNGGDNTTYCAGESALLDGGYLSYDDADNPDSGTPTVNWTDSGAGGSFTYDGNTTVGSVTATNFDNSENGVTGFGSVTYTPPTGIFSVLLFITASSTNGVCDAVTSEVLLFFDPLQEAVVDVNVDGSTEVDGAGSAGNSTPANATNVAYGDEFEVEITNSLSFTTGDQFEDILLFDYVIDGDGQINGLPASKTGRVSALDFNNLFENLVLTSNSCIDETFTVSLIASYERNPANFPLPSGPCPGPEVIVEVTVNPRPEPTATIGAIDDILVVCEDDADVAVVVTGTPFTQVTYTVSYDGGATVPAGPQTLELDATGTSFDILLNANDGTAGQDIVITLIEQEFLSGPPCLVTISKPLTIEVVPLPTLVLELADPDDAVICVEQSDVFIIISTNSGPGTYTFDLDFFLDGVLLTSGTGSATIGEGETLLTDLAGISTGPGGPGIGEVVPGLIEVVIDGTSITKDGEGLPSCTNDSPDASVSFFVQPELEIEFEAMVDDGPGQSLTQDNTPLNLTICDGQSIDFDTIIPIGEISHVPGITGALQVEIDDDDNLLGLGDDVVLTYDFDGNIFEFDQVFDIPNSQTDDSEITITITPYFEDNATEGLNGDECEGDPVVLNITVRPAPTVTVEVSDGEVCSGESVTVTITASEPGTANLILDQGGDPIPVDISHSNGDGTFFGTYTSADLTALTMFTVTTFIGNVAGCDATVNEMVMTDVEPLPEASVAADVSVCNDEDATVTFTGTAGNGTGFTFNYSISSNGETPSSGSVSTDGTDATVDVTFEPGDLPAGATTISLTSVANKGGLECINDAEGSVIISVEEEPIVSCDADDELICSGDDYSFTLTAGSALTSTIGSTLYYSVTTSVTTTVSTGTGSTDETEESTEIVPGSAGGVTISGATENMSGFNQTIEVSVTPFYVDDSGGVPTEIGDACTGETVTCSVTVKTMPMVTFGGTDAVCEGDVAGVIFTGPPNGRALVEVRDEDGNIIFPFVPIFFDDGGTSVLLVPNAPATFEVVLTTVADGPVLFNPDVCINEAEFSFTVNVTPSPEAEFDEDGTTVCEGDNPVIALTGTPFAQVSIDSDNDANDQVVNLDENGEGSFSVTADEDENFTISEIAITTQDGNGDDFTCTAEGDDDFELTVDPAPTGSLVSNRILCVGEVTEVIFMSTADDDYDGLYTVVVNGETYTGVASGDILPIVGLLTETTDFTLTSILQESAPNCASLLGAVFPIATVIVNDIPTAILDVDIEGSVTTVSDGVNDPFLATICSGDEVDFSLSGMPATSAAGDPLFFEIMVMADDADLLDEDLYRIPATDAGTLSDELDLPSSFINPSEADDAKLELMITPYYELDPEAPVGFMDVGGMNVNGFTDDFDSGEWVTGINNATDVTFTADEMVLEIGGPDFFGLDFSGNVFSAITFPEQGFVSFDIALDLETDAFFNDGVVIDFEGSIVYFIPVQFTGTLQGNFTAEESFSGPVPGGSTLTFGMLTDLSTLGNDRSTMTVSNWFFDPAAQPCPGEKIAVDITIKPALFADFSFAPERVCEGDNAEICITGTPNATVTVFLGNGIFNDVKLDGEGNGCFTTVGGLTEDTDFIIMGLTTLNDMPQCSFTFDVEERPVAPVMVVPTPTATVSLEPSTVCAGDEVSAEVTGTPNATVTYTYNNIANTVMLDEDGFGEIPLGTDNNTTSNIVCHIVLTDISVSIGDVTCTNDLSDFVTLIVRPLPTGEITAGDPACNGGSVSIFFEPTSDLVNNYRLRITDPNGVEINRNVEAIAGSPVLVFDATVPGTYSLIRIADGRMNPDAVVCVNEGEIFSTTTVVIEEVPNLTAAITGTVGTANLNSDDPVFNIFRALACDEATMNTVFGSSTQTAAALGNLMINVQVDANDEGQANVGSVGTSVITFDQLNDGDFLDGILSNVTDLDITSIEVILTPFFEGGVAGELDPSDCAGETLSFFIDILPEVQIEVDLDNSSLMVCEGDDVNIALTGSPGAEVMFSATGFTLTGDSEDGIIVLDETDGTATITGTAGSTGDDGTVTATITLDMVLLTTIEGSISRQCMLMDQGTTDITINEVPEAFLSVDPEGPICNGENVEVIATLVNTSYEDGDIFTFNVDGEDYTEPVDGHGSATLFISEALTETTTFTMSSVTDGNDLTACSNDLEDVSVTVMVEEVPTGEVVVTIDGEETIVSGGVPAAFQICANERIDMEANNTNDGAPLVGADYVSVDFSISEDIDFYGLGQSGTVALPIGDFEAQFSREYNMISGSPVTIDLEVTYYNETSHGASEVPVLDDGECVGITDFITITINPNPKTEDVMTMTCSSVALDYDLDDAITNGVVGATFTYTVASDDVDVSGLDRTVASDANVTDEFENFSTEDYIVEYTVTPFGTDGDADCQGNDFILTVTIKPEPVITDDLAVEVCSGAPTACVVELSNVGDNLQAFLEGSMFELTDIAYSLEGPDFILADWNAVKGSVGDYQFIAHDVFTNLSSEPQTVTYTILPTSGAGCVGETNTIVVTILPEAVVADMVMKVCSGGTIDLGFNELTANGVGNILSFNRRTTPLTTLRIFDEERDDVTLGAFSGFSPGTPGITAIQDSFLNQGTATLSVFYDVEIQVTGETGDEGGPLTCEASTFTLEVQVVEEVDVVLEPIAGQTAICAGEPITLVATYDGSGNEQSFDYSYVSADGVVLELTPSAAGGEVVVDAVSGMGNATVMVMVTDDNSCLAMATRTVSVGTSPEVMEIAGFEDPCIGDFSFYGITPTAGSTYEWSISNPDAGTFTNTPATGPNTSITFNASQGFGPFDVMVTETSHAGCSTTSSLTVNLSSETVADFTAVESAGDPLTFNFTELAGGGVEAYIWNFGDGVGTSHEQNPSYTYAPADPDAMATYTVTLTVLGCSGPVSTSIDVLINSNLEMDVIELYQGINFISFDVAPEDNRFDAILSGISGVRRVTTVNDGAATFYQPGAGPFNSLQTAEPGYGYVVIMDNDATLTLTGEPLDDAFIRPMGMGINYMAFIPEGSMVAADFWAPFEASPDFKLARTFGDNVTPSVQSYFPGFGPFNSMQSTFNGVGYMVLTRNDADPLASVDLESSSEDYEFVYGTVSGIDHLSNERIEIIGEAGNIIGYLNPDRSGLFKATPLYGKVEGEDGVVMGAIEAGEPIAFRYQGQVIDAGVSFQGQFAGTELKLDFNAAADTDQLTLRVQPNPAHEQTTLVLQLTAPTDLSVEAIDATGRTVRTLLPRQTLAEGTTTIEWDDLGQLPAGMYHILVTRDGRIDTELTQRLVKR